MKVRIGSYTCFVEKEFHTAEEADQWITTEGVLFLKSFNTLNDTVPFKYEMVKETVMVKDAVGQELPVQREYKQANPPQAPQEKRKAEVCPGCGKNTLWLNTVQKEGKNKGKQFKSCSNEFCTGGKFNKPVFVWL